MILITLALVTDAATLNQAIAAAHHDKTVSYADKFAAPSVSDDTIGKPFVITFPVQDGDSTGVQSGTTSAYYTYKQGRLRVILSSQEISDSDYAHENLRVFKIRTRVRAGQPFVGSNAYGVRTRVSVKHADEDGVAIVSGPHGEQYPFDDPIFASGPATGPQDTFWADISVSGAAARAAAADLAVRVEGTTARLPDGKPTGCKADYIGAEITSPTEIYSEFCWAGADISRIAIIRSKSGEVVKEWTK